MNGISCDPFTACGGNIVGTWRLVSSCGSVSSSPCPSSERITAKSSVTLATYTFASDGTFTFVASGDLTEALRYPLACLSGITDAGIPQACADIEHAFVTPPQTGDAGTQTVEVKSASCAAAANETCACTAVLRPRARRPRAAAPTRPAAISSPSSPRPPTAVSGTRAPTPSAEYCVSGNTLTLHFVNSSDDWVTKLTR